jgi:tetratricopeptide (TPR) repeat protein
LQYLNQVISANPEDQSVLLRYARLSIKAEKIDEAKQSLMNMVEKDPSNLDAKKLLGIIYNDEGQIEEAWNELQPCIDDAVSDKNWADALAMLNNFEEVNSMPVRQRFVDIYRGNGDNESLLTQLKDLGTLLENKGSNAEALKLYKEALEIKSDDPAINDKVTELESTVNNSADEQAGAAEEGQESPVVKDEGMPNQYLEAKKTEADFYVQQGLNEEAVKIYEELHEANPDDEVIIKAMNSLKSSDGSQVSSNETQESPGSAQIDINSAMNEILQEAGVDQTSDDVDYEVHFQKSIDLRRQGQLDEAIQELQKASRDPDNVIRNSRMLAMCYVEQGSYGDAIGQYERAVNELSSETAGFLDIQYELAEAYMKNGENDKALIRYSEINQYDSTFRDVAEKIESLQPEPEQVEDVPVMSSAQTAVKSRPKKNRISYL